MTKRNIVNIINELDKKGSKPEGLVFPCIYPIKAMGKNTNKFYQEIFFIAQKHCPDTLESDVRTTQSKTGKYQSITIKVDVKSRSHLEALYLELKNHDDVKWTL